MVHTALKSLYFVTSVAVTIDDDDDEDVVLEVGWKKIKLASQETHFKTNKLQCLTIWTLLEGIVSLGTQGNFITTELSTQEHN